MKEDQYLVDLFEKYARAFSLNLAVDDEGFYVDVGTARYYNIFVSGYCEAVGDR